MKSPEHAERRIFLSIAEARTLPNLLGRIVPAMLEAHGFYQAMVGGVTTLYIRVPPFAVRDALRTRTLRVGRGVEQE